MRYCALPAERRCDMAKKKEDLPVFVVVEMPMWKNMILDFMLKLLRVPGQAWVIGIKDTGFDLTAEGPYVERKKKKGVKDNEERAIQGYSYHQEG